LLFDSLLLCCIITKEVKYMKKFLLLILITQFIVLVALGQDEISCGEGSCNIPPSLDVQNTSGGSNYTSFDLVPLSQDVDIIVDDGDRPENTRAAVDFNSRYVESFNVDLSGQAEGDAGSIFIVTDIADQINLMLSGATGNPGMSSSQICGENFLSGAYGVAAQTFFNNRIISDTDLSNDCDLTDIEYIDDNEFSCPSGFSENLSPNVNVERFQSRRQCQGNFQQTRCVRRSYTIACESNRVMDRCCDEGNYQWSDKQGDGKLTAPYSGATCNPIKCSPLGSSDWYESGEVAVLNFEAWESEVLNTTPDELCKIKKEALPKPSVFYSTMVHQIEGDTDSPLVPGPNINYTEELPLDGNGNFLVPIPDVASFPNNDTTSSLPATEVFVKIHKDESTLAVSNCFGLDGSNLTDRECTRNNPGPAVSNGLVISFMDKFGVASNKIYVNVASSSSTQCSLITFNHNWTNYFSNRVTDNGYTVGSNWRMPSYWGGLWESWMEGRMYPGRRSYYKEELGDSWTSTNGNPPYDSYECYGSDGPCCASGYESTRMINNQWRCVDTPEYKVQRVTIINRWVCGSCRSCNGMYLDATGQSGLDYLYSGICMRRYYHGSAPSRVKIGQYQESDYSWNRGSCRRTRGNMPPLP
jgi:hypothetical protein